MSEDELDEQEYVDKLERFGQRLEYGEFEKHHPATRVLPEELSKDWFLFENRLRYFTYEIIKPVLAQ
jgi:hypothetical protein